jgi:large subunit ribosomal protein L24
MHVKKGDKVIVIAGKDKGASGTVIKSFPKKSMIVVEGVNKMKRHQKARKGSAKGQIVEKTMPIHVSNVKKA